MTRWRALGPTVLVVASVLVSAPASADGREQRRSRRAEAQSPQPAGPDEERRLFAVGRGATLDISNIAGDVRITAEPGDSIVVQTTRRLGDRRRDGSAPRVEMSQVGNRIEVRARGSRSSRSSSAVDIIVTAPPGTPVLARSVSGHVALTGIEGDVRLETVSGNVDVVRAANVTLAKTVSGDVVLRDSGSSATLTLGTVSGSVTATNVRARGLEATSVSGGVRLEGIAAQQVLAKSVSGDLEFAGTLASGGRFELVSHSGDVRLRLPAAASFDLQADTFSGRLTSDFPVTLRSTRTSRSSRAIRGVSGDGAAQLVLRSFSGSVTIVRQ